MVDTPAEIEARKILQYRRAKNTLLAAAFGGGHNVFALQSNSKFFDSQGGSTAYYGSTQFNSFYDSVGNKTYVAYEEIFPAPLKRFTRIRYFDHATKTWSRSYNVGAESFLANDSHGVPAIAMNSAGRIVVCWGNHDGPFHISVSTNPRDITAWTAGTDITAVAPGTGVAYPHLVLLPSNAMILLFRKNFAPGTGGFAAGAKVLVYHSLTFTGAVITDGGEVTIGDFGNDSRWYQGDALLLPNGRIAQVATKADFNDTVRLNIYYYELDIAGAKLYNYGGGVNTAFPITLAAMDASYKVYTTLNGTGNTPAFTIDSNGRTHFVQNDGTTSDGGGSNESSQNMVHIVSNGPSTFDAPYTFGTTTQRYNGYDLIPYSDGSVSIFWSKDEFGGTTQRGGSIAHRKLPPNSPSSAMLPETIFMRQDLTRFQMDTPASVLNGTSDIRLFWFERAPDDNDAGNYGKRIYAWGESGGMKAQVKPSLIIPPSLTGDGFWMDLSDGNRIFNDAGVTKAAIGDQIIQINDRFGTGNILTGVGGTAPFLDKYGEQLCLKFTGSSVGTRFLSTIAKQWTLGPGAVPGFMCTGIFRHWMPSTTSLSLISLDAGVGFARVCQPINMNGKEIRGQAFNGVTSTLLTHGAGNDPYVEDYIVQCYTDTNGTNLSLSINGAVVAGPTPITGGAVNTTSVLMRIGATAAAAPAQFFMGIMMGMVFRSGDQPLATRDADYQWALTQLPL